MMIYVMEVFSLLVLLHAGNPRFIWVQMRFRYHSHTLLVLTMVFFSPYITFTKFSIMQIRHTAVKLYEKNVNNDINERTKESHTTTE